MSERELLQKLNAQVASGDYEGMPLGGVPLGFFLSEEITQHCDVGNLNAVRENGFIRSIVQKYGTEESGEVNYWTTLLDCWAKHALCGPSLRISEDDLVNLRRGSGN